MLKIALYKIYRNILSGGLALSGHTLVTALLRVSPTTAPDAEAQARFVLCDVKRELWLWVLFKRQEQRKRRSKDSIAALGEQLD